MSKKGLVYAFAAVIFWATLGLSLKLSVTYLDDFSVAFFIGVLSILSFTAIILLRKEQNQIIPQLQKHWKSFLLAGIVGFGIQQLAYIIAYALLPASITVVLFYTYPLMIVILAILFTKESVSIGKICALIGGFIGVIVIVTKGSLSQFTFSVGLLFAIGAAISWAVFSHLIKKSTTSPTIAMLWYSVFGQLFLTACLIKYSLHIPQTTASWLGLIYVAIVPTALAFIFWNKALQLVQSTICAGIALLTPVLSLILISIVLKESLQIIQYVGFGIVLVSIGYLLLDKK